jgi:hypothetical protein
MRNKKEQSSFRDPSGFLYFRNGQLLRQVNMKYKSDYDMLMKTSLFDELVNNGLLISHEKESVKLALKKSIAYKVIRPEVIPFVSYPYEWSFSQLKDAALLTLEIQKIAMEKGMSLKDASAYNVQFKDGKPVFVDTLSFEKYKKGEPWVAYRQFNQHFLAPLALMVKKDVRLNNLLRLYIDGIPLDLASKLLPFGTRLSFPLLIHIHLHATSQQRYSDKKVKKASVSEKGLMGIIDSLKKAIELLNWEAKGTEWGEYYDFTNYTKEGFEHKKELVKKYVKKTKAKNVWDLGANTGVFSFIASGLGAFTVSMDYDEAAIEKAYLHCKKEKEGNILPLKMDLTNPSPGIGWENEERKSLLERGPADTVLALALIHHLAISNNLPFVKIAEFFTKIGEYIVIEFVPKNDSQVQKLLRNREDVFDDYEINSFEKGFGKYFKILDKESIKESKRVLYLLKKK